MLGPGFLCKRITQFVNQFWTKQTALDMSGIVGLYHAYTMTKCFHKLQVIFLISLSPHRCIGLAPKTVVSCMKAGADGFVSHDDFQIEGTSGCEHNKVNPFFGRP